MYNTSYGFRTNIFNSSVRYVSPELLVIIANAQLHVFDARTGLPSDIFPPLQQPLVFPTNQQDFGYAIMSPVLTQEGFLVVLNNTSSGPAVVAIGHGSVVWTYQIPAQVNYTDVVLIGAGPYLFVDYASPAMTFMDVVHNFVHLDAASGRVVWQNELDCLMRAVTADCDIVCTRPKELFLVTINPQQMLPLMTNAPADLTSSNVYVSADSRVALSGPFSYVNEDTQLFAAAIDILTRTTLWVANFTVTSHYAGSGFMASAGVGIVGLNTTAQGGTGSVFVLGDSGIPCPPSIPVV